MNKLHYYLLVVGLLLLYGCNIYQQSTKSTKESCFSFLLAESDYSKEQDVCINIHPGRRKKITTSDGSIYIEQRLYYKDGAIFYIKNDNWTSSRLNMKHLYDIGIRGYRKQSVLDTISCEGFDSLSKTYWRESVLGQVIVGYVNANDQKKLDFDSAIKSISILSP